MAVEWYEVSSGVRAFIDTLGKMTAAQKRAVPSPSCIENLNRYLALAIETKPGIDARLWPVHLDRASGATYADIETYARQIKGLIEGPSGPAIVVNEPQRFDRSPMW